MSLRIACEITASRKIVRPPLTGLTPEQEKQALTELTAAGFSMPGL